jgi:hypothetical protein
MNGGVKSISVLANLIVETLNQIAEKLSFRSLFVLFGVVVILYGCHSLFGSIKVHMVKKDKKIRDINPQFCIKKK